MDHLNVLVSPDILALSDHCLIACIRLTREENFSTNFCEEEPRFSD